MPRVKKTQEASGAPAANQEVRFDASRYLEHKDQFSPETQQKLTVLESAMLARKYWSDLLGQTFGGDRDIYDEAGWKKNPCFADFKRLLERQDIARTLVSAYPEATWREPPRVREDDSDEETEFERAFKEHAESTNLWHYMTRFDIMCGVGSYGAMLLGLDDGRPLVEEATSATRVMFHQLFFEGDAEVGGWERDPRNERYGLPSNYRLTTRIGLPQDNANTPAGQKLMCHHSRVIHGAEGCLESDVFGTPRLQVVYNRLEDLEKILGASGEGYYKRAFPGTAIIKEDDADWGNTATQMEDEIEAYYHKLTRWMRLSGVTVQELNTAKMEDPLKHYDMQIQMLACASRIPKRILTGSERGELSSQQDEGNWLARVDERRKNFAWPVLLRQYIKKLIALGILPEPKELTCEWADVEALGERDQADVAAKQSAALKAYADGLEKGVDLVMPPYFFLVDVMHLDEDRVEEYTKLIDERQKEIEAEEEEARQIEEENRKHADEQAALDRAAKAAQKTAPKQGGPQA
jgi:hypothetical protein